MTGQHLAASLQNRVVFKDQCTQCFQEPLQARVIVCLACLNGGCDSHSQQHFQKTQHPLGLGIRLSKTVSVDKEDKKLIHDQKIEFHTSLTIHCFACQLVFPVEDTLPAPLKSLVESVVQHKSYFQSVEIAGFELDIQPCEHSLLLQQ